MTIPVSDQAKRAPDRAGGARAFWLFAAGFFVISVVFASISYELTGEFEKRRFSLVVASMIGASLAGWAVPGIAPFIIYRRRRPGWLRRAVVTAVMGTGLLLGSVPEDQRAAAQPIGQDTEAVVPTADSQEPQMPEILCRRLMVSMCFFATKECTVIDFSQDEEAGYLEIDLVQRQALEISPADRLIQEPERRDRYGVRIIYLGQLRQGILSLESVDGRSAKIFFLIAGRGTLTTMAGPNPESPIHVSSYYNCTIM